MPNRTHTPSNFALIKEVDGSVSYEAVVLVFTELLFM